MEPTAPQGPDCTLQRKPASIYPDLFFSETGLEVGEEKWKADHSSFTFHQKSGFRFLICLWLALEPSLHRVAWFHCLHTASGFCKGSNTWMTDAVGWSILMPDSNHYYYQMDSSLWEAS